MYDFVHLHLHSQYSPMSGMIRFESLLPLVKQYGMGAVAVTDHWYMRGIFEFYRAAKLYQVKPIIGCEILIRPEDRIYLSDSLFPLVLLVRNQEGFNNLCRLTGIGFEKTGSTYPAISLKTLSDHSNGLIGLSGGHESQVNRTVAEGRIDRAAQVAKTYKQIFEPGYFFLELQRIGLEEDKRIVPALLELGKVLGIEVVATNDCQYLTDDEAIAHDILATIKSGEGFDGYERRRLANLQCHLRSPTEMGLFFHDIPEVVSNTVNIADMCNFELGFTKFHSPHFKGPKGKTTESDFKDLAFEGLKKRIGSVTDKTIQDEYRIRLEYEISVVQSMGFEDYFLIIANFVQYAREKGIPVGPGRGSAAGSLLAYSLGITDVDPIRYGLLFERFINPSRISFPDIDVDICEERREEILEYLRDKYGADKVGRTSVYQRLRTKETVVMVCRTLGYPLVRIRKLISDVPNILREDGIITKLTVKKLLERKSELKELCRTDSRLMKVMDISRKIEGLFIYSYPHAAGFVIADMPLCEMVPVCASPDGKLQTQFDRSGAETAGLVVFDILGLNVLTVIEETKELVLEKHPSFDPDTIPLNNSLTYELLSNGDTKDIFQLDSLGIRKLFKLLKPKSIEDIAAGVALSRRSTKLQKLTDKYIGRKNGDVPVTYIHPLLEPILKATYGIIVYQEQVMKIGSAIGGMSLDEADMFRKALGKKKMDDLERYKNVFISSAIGKTGMTQKQAVSLWEMLYEQGPLAFNKAHAISYALLTYKTAWLKTHFPEEFNIASNA